MGSHPQSNLPLNTPCSWLFATGTTLGWPSATSPGGIIALVVVLAGEAGLAMENPQADSYESLERRKDTNGCLG